MRFLSIKIADPKKNIIQKLKITMPQYFVQIKASKKYFGPVNGDFDTHNSFVTNDGRIYSCDKYNILDSQLYKIDPSSHQRETNNT